MRSPEEIVAAFIKSGYAHQLNIPGNRVFLTDMTSSTLAYVQGNVVIEYYFLFPNIDAPGHSHPFVNQIIFLSGDLIATKGIGTEYRTKTFTDDDAGWLGSLMPVGGKHKFKTGDRGAVIYNIQIWPEDVVDARSAAIEFIGPSMGPKHKDLKST